MKLMELINEYDRSCAGMLEATEQSVYISLVLIWNRLRRPEWFQVSRPELMHKAGIKGKDRLDKARKALEEKGFISSQSTSRTSPRKFHLEPLPTRPEIGLARPEISLEARPTMSLTRPEIGLAENTVDLKQVQHWTQNRSNLDPKQVTSQRQSYTEISNPSVEIADSNLENIPPEVLNAFQEEIRLIPSPVEIEKLKDLVREHKPEPVVRALQRAAMRNKRSLGYAEAILKSWQQNGYDDPEGGDTNGPYRQGPRRNANRAPRQTGSDWSQVTEYKPGWG